MSNESKEKKENPAKNINPTPLPVKETREDGKKYRFTLDNEENKKSSK